MMIECCTCGREFERYPSMVRERNFCCNQHRLQWLSEYTRTVMNVQGHSKGHKAPHLTELNRLRTGATNPMKDPETREKVGNALRNRGNLKSYRKYYGRHEHRIVAEITLGRPLLEGEIVPRIYIVGGDSKCQKR
ncbi:hypothetical protein FACS1894202_09360 [Clostridia bacterium]|nr:hypothetical protein FACS1894202_09360 [Clostridia bacterium]